MQIWNWNLLPCAAVEHSREVSAATKFLQVCAWFSAGAFTTELIIPVLMRECLPGPFWQQHEDTMTDSSQDSFPCTQMWHLWHRALMPAAGMCSSWQVPRFTLLYLTTSGFLFAFKNYFSQNSSQCTHIQPNKHPISHCSWTTRIMVEIS